MGSGLFFTGIVITTGVTAYLIRRYSDPTNPIAVTLLVGFTWFLSFSVVALMPFDISSTFFLNCVKQAYCSHGSPASNFPNGINSTWNDAGCGPETSLKLSDAAAWCATSELCECTEPSSFVSSGILSWFWNMVYWSSQLLTWLLLPLLESYMSAGDFTPWGKFKASLKENAIAYGSLAVIAGAVAIYVVVDQGLSGTKLKQAVMMASNMWGLFMVILLLGYGLVDVPRRLWYQTNSEYTLRTLHFRASKLSSEISDAQLDEEELEEQIKSVASAIKHGDPARKFVDMLLRKAKLDSMEDYEDFKSEEMNDPTVSTLVKLHKRLIKTKRVVNRCQCQWNALMDTTFDVQDTIENAKSQNQLYNRSLGGDVRYPAALWIWKIRAKPMILQALAAVCTLMSIILLWSEVTFRSKEPVLSVYALAVIGAGTNNNYVATEFLTFVLLLYLCVCTYMVVFRIRVFDFFYLVPNQQTDSSSMLWSAMILSRLTAPLCLNFLGMVHMDSHISNTNSTTLTQETAFTQVQGHMDLFNEFNAYYSIVVCVLALCALLKVGNRILSMMGMTRFVDNDEDTDDMVKEGKMYVQREHRRRERSGNSYADFTVTKEKMFDKEGGGAEAAVADPVRARTGLGRTRPKKRAESSDADDYDPRGSSNNLADGMSFDSSSKPKAKSKSSFGSMFSSKKARDDDEDELIPSRARKAKAKGGRNMFDDI